jgi:hypothetical protein
LIHELQQPLSKMIRPICDRPDRTQRWGMDIKWGQPITSAPGHPSPTMY